MWQRCCTFTHHTLTDRKRPRLLTLLLSRSLLKSCARIRLMASNRMACCALLLFTVLLLSPQAAHTDNQAGSAIGITINVVRLADIGVTICLV